MKTQRKKFRVATILLMVCLSVSILLLSKDRQQRYWNHQLVAAVKRDDVPGVKAALDHGASANARDVPPESITSLSVLRDMLRRLRGQPPMSLSSASYPQALLVAVGGGGYNAVRPHDDPALIRALLAGGADIDAEDPEGWTPLIYAAIAGNATVAQCLLANGAAVNHADRWGRTALTWASDQNQAEIIHILLQSGADVNHKDSWNRTPLSWTRGRPGVTAQLKQAGAIE